MTERSILFLWFLLLFTGGATGHDARPISIEITQQAESPGYDVKIKVPDAIRVPPRLDLPKGCDRKSGHRTSLPGSILVQSAYLCDALIDGRQIAIRFLTPNPSLSTVLRVSLAGGVSHSTILGPGEERWIVPAQEKADKVAMQYARLGIEHIWFGVDHLLFVLCLLFIAGRSGSKRWRRVLVTITGFTVAHSITLVLSALGMVVLPILAVEAVIALSIVFLGLELLRKDQASWTYRYPQSVAMSFGLLHGFGFASVLREIGLPQTELPVALLFFNLGIELGQVMFIAIIMLLGWLVRGRLSGREDAIRTFAGYLVGMVSSYWLIDRTLAFWMAT